MSKEINSQEIYTEEENINLSSFTPIADSTANNYEAYIWLRVITKAIDDLSFFINSLEVDRPLNIEIWNYALTAYCFLFCDDYSVPIEDYYVDIYCSNCDDVWVSKMSELTPSLSNTHPYIICPLCKAHISWKDLQTRLSLEQNIKGITLKEILSMWNCNNIKSFRQDVMTKIHRLVDEKKRAK